MVLKVTRLVSPNAGCREDGANMREQDGRSRIRTLVEHLQEQWWVILLLPLPCLSIWWTQGLIRPFVDSAQAPLTSWFSKSTIVPLNPISYVQPFSEDGRDLVYSVTTRSDVKAAFDGVIRDVRANSLVISEDIPENQQRDLIWQGKNPQSTYLLRYHGLTRVLVHNNQAIKRGDVVGMIEPGNPDPHSARLRVQLKYAGEFVETPVGVKDAYEGLDYGSAKHLYQAYCYSCHDVTGTSLFRNGKMADGVTLATVESVISKVRTEAPNGKMPRFGKALLEDDKLEIVAKYLIATFAPSPSVLVRPSPSRVTATALLKQPILDRR
jgi:mono/diheme cytochrome c family protein